jgi:hypothetical protein
MNIICKQPSNQLLPLCCTSQHNADSTLKPHGTNRFDTHSTLTTGSSNKHATATCRPTNDHQQHHHHRALQLLH